MKVFEGNVTTPTQNPLPNGIIIDVPILSKVGVFNNFVFLCYCLLINFF